MPQLSKEHQSTPEGEKATKGTLEVLESKQLFHDFFPRDSHTLEALL